MPYGMLDRWKNWLAVAITLVLALPTMSYG